MTDATLSRRKMLGLLGATGVALTGCQTKAKLAEVVEPQLLFGNSETGLAFAGEAARHTLEGHPESSLRAKVIQAQIIRAQKTDKLGPLFSIPPRLATVEELSLFHDPEYIAAIKNSPAGEYITKSKWSPYGGPHAFGGAASAAGAAIDLIRAIDEKKLRNGFAITRPPGHHATAGKAAGYCIFNNIAVAVRALQQTTKRRIAIVDFDQHHGNGIQDAFYKDENVLYISTHQISWPHTGAIEQTGEGAGKGTNVNIALPAGTGDAGLFKVYEEIVIPLLRRFKPDLIVAAAGFDTHWRDYQGSFILSLLGIARIVDSLNTAAKEFCEGRIAFILEGGYQLEVLGAGAANLMFALAGAKTTAFDPFGRPDQNEADVASAIKKIRRIHRL